MTRKDKMRVYSKIIDYIFKNFSVSFQSERTGIFIQQEYVYDIGTLCRILGKMEIYYDNHDFENFDLMVLWFDRELDKMDYMLDDFIDFAIEDSEDDDISCEVNKENDSDNAE